MPGPLFVTVALQLVVTPIVIGPTQLLTVLVVTPTPVLNSARKALSWPVPLFDHTSERLRDSELPSAYGLPDTPPMKSPLVVSR